MERFRPDKDMTEVKKNGSSLFGMGDWSIKLAVGD
jgi:hypothetical protein